MAEKSPPYGRCTSRLVPHRVAFLVVGAVIQGHLGLVDVVLVSIVFVVLVGLDVVVAGLRDVNVLR